MNDSNFEFDAALAERFRSEHSQIAIEPFVSATLRRVEAERTRGTVFRYALRVAALVAVVWASPWLIEASAVLSAELDDLFAKASALLSTPVGMGIAALGVTLSAAIFRGRTSR